MGAAPGWGAPCRPQVADHPEYLPLYRALVESARDLLGVLDLDGRLRYLSPAARAVFDRPPASLIDTSLLDWLHPDDEQTVRDWIRRLTQRDGDAMPCRMRVGSPGRWRTLDTQGVCLREDPVTRRIAFSGADVTEREQATRLMEASEQKFRGAFDRAPIGKALLGADGCFAEVNATLAEMLDCWVSELIGRRLDDFLSAADAGRYGEALAQVLADPGQVPDLELELVTTRGERRWGWLNLSSLGGGSTPLLILQVQDVTARHQAEARLRESNEDLRRSNEELKRFAFIASHDLREPLRGIKGSIQLLLRRYREAFGEDGLELAQQSLDGVSRLQALTDELLAYAEQMRGSELERAPVSVQNVVQDVLAELDGAISEAGAFIDLGTLPTVLGDQAQLHQVFLQLIDNALKFRHPDRPPRIRIGAEWAKSNWRIEVADNGIGVDPEHHQQIFEVFRRLHTDDRYPGTGMGLATVRKIIERHGGSITLDSAAGEGARFSFELPPE